MENPHELDKVSKNLTRPVDKTTEGAVPDLRKLTKPQLLELRDRQKFLLKNKSRLQKLPDRGRRIQEMLEKVEKRLRELDEVDEAARLFSDLNIASRGQKSLTNLEWTGKCDPQADIGVDSDDEEMPDPLKVLAQSQNLEKIVKIVKETPLITKEDLQEIESFSEVPQASHLVETELRNSDKLQKLRQKYQKPPQSDESRSASSLSGTSGELEGYAVYLCDKEQSTTGKEKFRPYQTTKTNVHNPEAEIERGTRKKWDLTAATPPLLSRPGVKMMTLQESMELQLKKQEEIKVLEKQKAEAKLFQKSLKMTVGFQTKDLGQFFKTYREVPESDSLSDISESSESLQLDSGDEVEDIDAVDTSRGVVVKFSQ